MTLPLTVCKLGNPSPIFLLEFAAFFVIRELVPQVQSLVLLGQLDDEVGLFGFQVLCLCLFNDILELHFFVPGGLLQPVHQVESLALHCLLEARPSQLLPLSHFLAPLFARKFNLLSEVLGALLALLLFGLQFGWR